MQIFSFQTRDENETALLRRSTEIITAAIHQYGEARILLSGGSTPKHFYTLLSMSDFDWDKILVGLVDERYVPTDHPSSNERMLRDCLLQNQATNARLIGMVADDKDRAKNNARININYSPFKGRIDLLILGMGEDGHTASLFPNDSDSEFAMQSDEIKIFDTSAPNEPKERITCGLKMLRNAQNKILLITGESKLRILQEATHINYPISAFTGQDSDLAVYYSK